MLIAGVPFLYNGLKVTLMSDSEQAKDNINHKQPVMDKDSDQNTPANTSSKG